MRHTPDFELIVTEKILQVSYATAYASYATAFASYATAYTHVEVAAGLMRLVRPEVPNLPPHV